MPLNIGRAPDVRNGKPAYASGSPPISTAMIAF
jgi:hypothetical protein